MKLLYGKKSEQLFEIIINNPNEILYILEERFKERI